MGPLSLCALLKNFIFVAKKKSHSKSFKSLLRKLLVILRQPFVNFSTNNKSVCRYWFYSSNINLARRPMINNFRETSDGTFACLLAQRTASGFFFFSSCSLPALSFTFICAISCFFHITHSLVRVTNLGWLGCTLSPLLSDSAQEQPCSLYHAAVRLCFPTVNIPLCRADRGA